MKVGASCIQGLLQKAGQEYMYNNRHVVEHCCCCSCTGCCPPIAVPRPVTLSRLSCFLVAILVKNWLAEDTRSPFRAFWCSSLVTGCVLYRPSMCKWSTMLGTEDFRKSPNWYHEVGSRSKQKYSYF